MSEVPQFQSWLRHSEPVPFFGKLINFSELQFFHL